jgi:hypothetical protein
MRGADAGAEVIGDAAGVGSRVITPIADEDVVRGGGLCGEILNVAGSLRATSPVPFVRSLYFLGQISERGGQSRQTQRELRARL